MSQGRGAVYGFWIVSSLLEVRLAHRVLTVTGSLRNKLALCCNYPPALGCGAPQVCH